MDIEGRVAFVTAGVSGIGLGIARALGRAGARLSLTYRNEAHRAQAERGFAEERLGTPQFLKLDVTDRPGFARAAANAEEHWGAIDILVNNAGVSVFGATEDATYADHDWIMGVNYGGTVNGLVSVLPALRRRPEAHIVNVASMAAYLSGPQAGIYTASKFAIRGLTESLRFSLASQNIGVSLMCPGLTRTNAWDSALRRPDDFSNSGFGEVDAAQLEAFGTAFDAGMDPDEVGEKTVAGIRANRGLIFSHPEYAGDFRAIYEESIAALPNEEAPPARLKIEAMRRAAAEAALTRRIGIDDLT